MNDEYIVFIYDPCSVINIMLWDSEKKKKKHVGFFASFLLQNFTTVHNSGIHNFHLVDVNESSKF